MDILSDSNIKLLTIAPTVLEIELPKHGRLLLVLPAGAAPVPVVGMVAPAPPVSVTLKRSFLLGPEFRGGFPCLLKLFPAALHFLHVAFPENECRLLYGSVHVGRHLLFPAFWFHVDFPGKVLIYFVHFLVPRLPNFFRWRSLFYHILPFIRESCFVFPMVSMSEERITCFGNIWWETPHFYSFYRTLLYQSFE